MVNQSMAGWASAEDVRRREAAASVRGVVDIACSLMVENSVNAKTGEPRGGVGRRGGKSSRRISYLSSPTG
jgi:hypothetical protein